MAAGRALIDLRLDSNCRASATAKVSVSGLYRSERSLCDLIAISCVPQLRYSQTLLEIVQPASTSAARQRSDRRVHRAGGTAS